MENSYDYTLYETTISSGDLLNSRNNVRDRALGERTLSLLVENSGRANCGKLLDEQRKGLVRDIELTNTPLRDFIIHILDMKPGFVNRLSAASQWNSVPQKPSFPGFFQGMLYVDGHPRDTFIRLPVIVFEEQEADGKIQFARKPDLGMTVDV